MRRIFLCLFVASAFAFAGAPALADHHEGEANPCTVTNPCNPCGAKNPCNPCGAKNPCNPCGAKTPANPCDAKNPCKPGEHDHE